MSDNRRRRLSAADVEKGIKTGPRDVEHEAFQFELSAAEDLAKVIDGLITRLTIHRPGVTRAEVLGAALAAMAARMEPTESAALFVRMRAIPGETKRARRQTLRQDVLREFQTRREASAARSATRTPDPVEEIFAEIAVAHIFRDGATGRWLTEDQVRHFVYDT